MANVIELNPAARARQRGTEFTHVVGMVVALASWGMMFACAFFVYFGLRSQEAMWPPVGLPRLPVALPALNTVVIIASSLTLGRALATMRRGGPAVRWMGVTLGLGLGFVGLQLLLWRNMWLDGVTVATGKVGTVFYGLTGLHAVHVAAGIAVLGYLMFRASRDAKSPYDPTPVVRLRMCGMFWHFVGGVWVFMFLAMFLF